MTFPGIIASVIVFYDSALYGEVFLQVIFLISGILGIYNWQVLGRSKKEQVLHKLGLKWYLPYLGLFIVFYLGFYYFLISFTDSTTPHWDALITAMSLVAQLMLTRQIFENWTLWVIVDVCSVGLYWYKGIPLYAVLYLVYLYLALQGWYIWHRNLKEGKVLAE
jgi:nicotinamide mononucleotide transporter